ncbi:MAG: leucine-rich repeat domain-containing protein, partial [Clostridiales bacterium]|nr:leucine-rich repeat domain-containing protein [Clostridiales bacterium]
MKKQLSKMTSVFLVLLFALGSFSPVLPEFGALLGFDAFAESASGTCGDEGDNLTWTLDTSSGVLTIDGNGKMASYTSSNRPGWYDYKDQITSVTVSEGVTSIGNYAFRDCSAMTDASLPSSLKTIGQNAFGASGLTSITIPENVTKLDNMAFGGCKDLTTINYNATSLTSVTGTPFSLAGAERKPVSVVFGDSVQTIPDDLFKANYDNWMLNITSVTFGSSVKTIGARAFKNMSGIVTLVLPASLETIGNDAFLGCSGLKGWIDIPQ